MELLFELQFDNGGHLKAMGDDTLALQTGDFCVIRKDFYIDVARIIKIYGPTEKFQDLLKPPTTAMERRDEPARVQRKASEADLEKSHENIARAHSALRTAGYFVNELNLPMKLINAHYSCDGKLLTIQFSAEGRVDFRELVKQLSGTFNTRIELRQIGVRDETAALGGISPCGRPLCCCTFLHDFASINVKMAKEQDLALTPTTISGVCGRLKCCLKYEHEGYLELEKTMPRRGDCCECAEGRGRIIDRNLLSQKVVVQLEGSERSITCTKDEVRVVYPERHRRSDEPSAEQSRSTTRNLPKSKPQNKQK